MTPPAAAATAEPPGSSQREWIVAQGGAFQAAMNGAPLAVSLGVMVDIVNAEVADGRRCGFYIADGEGAGLHHVVGMGEAYARAVDGFAISPESLACGLAVANGAPVITRDVEDDPRWRAWTWLAREYGYRACWSFPIETATGRLVGAFALYLREPHAPTPRDVELAAAVTQTAAIIIAHHQENEERARAEAALREAEGRQAFLLELSDALRPLEASAEIESAAVRLLGERLGADRVFYASIDPDCERWSFRQGYASGAPAILAAGRFAFTAYQRKRLPQWRAGQMSSVADSETDSALDADDRADYAAFGARAAIGVPLVKHGRLAALLVVNHAVPRRWSEAELGLTRDVAERTWAAMERARAEAALRESEERQAFLLTLSDDVRAAPDEAATGLICVEALARYLRVDRCYITEMSEERDSGVVGPEYRTAGLPPIAGEHSCHGYPDAVGRFRSGAPMVSSHVARDPMLSDRDKASIGQGLGLQAILCAFLYRGEGRTIWALTVGSAEPRQWTGDDIRLVQEVGERTWAAVERARAQRALRESEERQRMTIELVPALLWWADARGKAITVNPGWSDYTGQPESEAQDFGWLAMIHHDDLPATQAAFERAFATGEPLERQQRIRKAASGYRWHLVRQVPVRGPEGEIVRWFGAATDIHELHELQQHQRLLVAELQHRVRNILTVTRLTFSRTFEQGDGADEMASHFRGRLDAMARTQVTLSRTAHRSADLEDLIRDELLSVGATEETGVTLDGPEVALDHKIAESLGMALHELTTNALKYGALKVAGGRFAVRWNIHVGEGGGRVLDLVWEERGVPAVSVRPSREGFGRELIEEALPYRNKAVTSLEFRGGGVRCSISVPLPDHAGGATRRGGGW